MLCITACENPDLEANENQEQTGNDNKPSGGEGEGETESVKFMTITVERVSATKVVFKGTTKKTAPDIEVGLYWSKVQGSHINDCEKVSTYKITNGSFELAIEDLDADTKYYCYPYLFMNGGRELGDEFDFKTAQPKFIIDNVSVDGLTVTFTGYADHDCSVGIYCSTSSPSGYNYKTHHWIDSEDNNYTLTIDKLSCGTTYYYCTYVDKYSNDKPDYGEVKSFTTGNATITIDKVNVSENNVEFVGKAMLDCEGGILYSLSSTITKNDCLGIVNLSNITSSYIQSCILPSFLTRYYYCTYHWDEITSTYLYGQVKQLTTGREVSYDEAIKDLSSTSAIDLSVDGVANCYVVSRAGTYKIKTVKGNDANQKLANVSKPIILWETYGTDVMLRKLSLINGVCYKNGYLIFETPSTFKEGNAVVAVKDAAGNILWSWHIWLTDQPQGQVYFNNAGTMMDRNLGATSATPGDVGALGLFYQWGRKDPFLGSSSISDEIEAKSTITWPSAVSSNSSNGTIAYAVANPTTFIKYNSSNYDWYYSGYSSTDNTRWTTSENTKSVYDPCPAGWRVPDGGDNGVWSKALGSSSYFSGYPYDSTNEGMNFSGKFGSASTIWYPASGCRDSSDGSLNDVGDYGYYWSASPGSNYAYGLRFGYYGGVYPSNSSNRAYGQSVRCLQESK